MRTGPWRLVDQPNAALFQLGKRRNDVVNAQADVMKTGPTFGDELRDGGIVGGGLE